MIFYRRRVRLQLSMAAFTRSKTRLLLRHPEAEGAFEASTRAIFHQWTALELAVSNQWGGPDSKEKAEDLCAEILDLFGGSKDVYKDVSGLCLLYATVFLSLAKLTVVFLNFSSSPKGRSTNP